LSVRIQKDKYGETQIRVDQYWPDGRRFRRNFANKRLAEDVDSKIRVARGNGTWRDLRNRLARGEDAKKITLDQFADRYLEEYCKTHNRAWQRKRDSIKALKSKLGSIEIEALDGNNVAKFISWRKSEGRTNGTINRDLACLKHMLSYAVKLELLKDNKVARVDKLPEILRCRPKFTDKQVDHFLACTQPRVRPLFGFMRETGCRLEEAMTLKRSQVLRDERRAVFTDNTKSGKFRVVPLTDEAVRWIDEMVPLAGCPYIFYNPRTRRQWKNCRKVIDKAINASNLDGFLLKDLRRHYGITLSENGAEMHVIQAMLGHSSVTTTEKHYAHFSPEFAASRALRVLEGRKKQESIGTQMGRESDASQVA
jgi:site-specific recombinase XerD